MSQEIVSKICSARKLPVRTLPLKRSVSILEEDYLTLCEVRHLNFLELFGKDKRNPQITIISKDYAEFVWEGKINGVFQEIDFSGEKSCLDGYYVALPYENITRENLQEAIILLEKFTGTRYKIKFDD